MVNNKAFCLLHQNIVYCFPIACLLAVRKYMFINSLSRKTDVSSYRIMSILAIPHMLQAKRAGEKANANVKCPGGPTRPSVMLLDR